MPPTEGAPPAQPVQAPGVPGWVKAMGLAGLLLVLALVVLHLTGLSPAGH